MYRYSFQELTIMFFIYSIIGYICEVIYCSLYVKKLVDRGFFYGPYCPIYGFGSLFVLIIIKPFKENIFIFMFFSIIITSIVEYFTSYLMEKVFNLKLWDYKDYKFNINGRVCIKNSLLFGLLSFVLVYIADGIMISFLHSKTFELKRNISSLIIIICFIDFCLSLNALTRLEKLIKDLRNVVLDLKKYQVLYSWFTFEDLSNSIIRLKNIAKVKEEKNILNTINKYEELVKYSKNNFRILKNYPKVSLKINNEVFEIFRENLKKKFSNASEKMAETFEDASLKVTSTFDNFSVKITKTINNVYKKMDSYEMSFAEGINFYKLFWVFLFSGLIGFLLETIFFFLTHGFYESRQGLLYGPFKQVYGFGAVILILLLSKYKEKRDGILFFASMLIGGLFEYFASIFEEKIFGVMSRDFTNISFSIDGRTNLLYMCFWGILGVILVKDIYPKVSRFIERLSNTQGYVITWIMIVAISFDILITGFSVKRWSERSKNITPKNSFEQYLDEEYSDSYMENVFPNMKIVTNFDQKK